MFPLLPSSSYTALSCTSVDQSQSESEMLRFDASKARAALSDFRSDDAMLADIFKSAFAGKKQVELNQIIKEIARQSGFPVTQVNRRVKELLFDAEIELIQSEDGTVQLSSCAAFVADEQRATLILVALDEFLPTSIVDVIQKYDASIAIGPKSRLFLLEAFRSRDPALKRQVLIATIEQNQKVFLNEVLDEIRRKDDRLDLDGVELDDLDLNGIDLSTPFSFGNSRELYFDDIDAFPESESPSDDAEIPNQHHFGYDSD